MTQALQNLIGLLDLEEIERDIYRGANEAGGRTRLFGGQVMAQALVAAGRTVEGRAVHSLHGYFLRPGDPSIPIVFTVDRIRDGGSFTTRSVVAVQRGEAIFELSASFHNAEPGFEHGEPMPDAPPPESLPSWEERVAAAGDRIPAEARPWMLGERPIDLRSTQGMSMFGGRPQSRPNYVWMRANGTLPENPFLHACIATYASDMSLLDSIIRRHVGGLPFRTVMMASLDHALWYHRPLRMDEWQLYVQESPAAAGGRGFARGTIYARDGRLVASVAQEGLLRPVPPRKGAAKKEGEPR